MDDSPDPRSYLERIESFFLSLVRKGMALRAADVALIRDWQRRGVPEDLVRRGLLEGVRRFLTSADPAAALPDHLRYYRSVVEEEIGVWQRARDQGRHLASIPAAPVAMDLQEVAVAHARTCAARARNEKERALWEDALQTLLGRHPSQSLLDLLDELDERLVEGLVRCAVPEVQADAAERVARAQDEARQRGAGPEALADLRRSEQRAVAEEHLGFQGLLDTVRRACEHPESRRGKAP